MVNANSKFCIKCLKTEAGVILSTILLGCKEFLTRSKRE